MKLTSQLKRNMASGSAATLISIGVMALSYPLYIHYLGRELFGLWLLLTTLLSVSRLSDFGIGLALAKLVAELHGRGEQVAVRRMIGAALSLIGTTTLLPLAILAFLPHEVAAILGLPAWQQSIIIPLIPGIGVLAVGGMLGEVLLSALTGLQRSDLANLYQSLGKLALPGVALPLIQQGDGLSALLVGTAAMQLVWISTALFSLARMGALPQFVAHHAIEMRHLLRFGRGIFAGNLFGLLLHPFSCWMLARFAGSGEIPLYDIAFRTAMQLRALMESALRALMTEMSLRKGSGTAIEQIIRLNRKVTIVLIALALPFFALLATFAPWWLAVWLGKSFAPEMIAPVRVAIVAAFISLCGVPTYYLAMGVGRVGICLRERILNAGFSMLFLTASLLLLGEVTALLATEAMLFSFSVSLCYLLVSTRNSLSQLEERIRVL